MLNKWFWSNTIIKQQKQEHCMNLQTDMLHNPLTTHPIQIGWEISREQNPILQFGCMYDPDLQFGDISLVNLTSTRSDGPEPLLTLALVN